jgi:hypothetical protein
MTSAGPLRVVLDTNCLVSALVFRANRLVWLRDSWKSGSFTPVLDKYTSQELLRVLKYPKFRLTKGERDALLGDLLPYVEVAEPADRTSDLPSIDDLDDVKFLALARKAETDALVTGDRDLLAVNQIVEFTTILSPSAFARWLASC